MGVSIRFTDKATQIDPPQDEDAMDLLWDTREHWMQGDICRKDYPHSGIGVDLSKCYKGDIAIFSAKHAPVDSVSMSYGGWNAFRERLSLFFNDVEPRVIWNSPELYEGRALFYNLIDFSDCEGILAPDTVRILGEDVRTIENTPNKDGDGSLSDGFVDYLNQLNSGFSVDRFESLCEGIRYAARSGGVISFG